jgi:hypothetical protein
LSSGFKFATFVALSDMVGATSGGGKFNAPDSAPSCPRMSRA